MVCALFFGSFNPIHFGHISIAKYLIENKSVDQVRLILSPQNPLKEESSLLDAVTRMNIFKKAILKEKDLDITKVLISNIEFSLPKPLYTINTLRHIKRAEPKNSHILIIGGDNIAIMEKWYKWQEILGEFEIWVYPRPGIDAGPICDKYNSMEGVKGILYLKDAPLYDISSTQIRQSKTPPYK